jgi:hypothetical protein
MVLQLEPENDLRGPNSSIALPEGLSKLVRRYQHLVLEALRSKKELAQDYISAFQVEPRGNSFLVGFRVGLVSGEEIFVYVEPASRPEDPEYGNQDTTINAPVNVWRYPHDPKLQTLASVVNLEPLGILFSRLKHAWVPSESALVAYRPGRRGVVKCGHGVSTAFVKVVRPRAASKVVSAARLALAEEVPTPAVIGWSPAGIAIYETADGIELSRASVSGVSPSVAVSTAFEAMSRLEKVETRVASRRPIIENFSWYFERASEAHPAEGEALKRLKAKIQAFSQRNADPGEVVTIHGDLHLGQLFVTKDKNPSLSGIIDLDDMGLGFVVDDVASMWANCVASARLAKLDEESQFWQACTKTLETWRLPASTDLSRLHSSISVHLVAQTLSTRGLDPTVAQNLVRDATKILS